MYITDEGFLKGEAAGTLFFWRIRQGHINRSGSCHGDILLKTGDNGVGCNIQNI